MPNPKMTPAKRTRARLAYSLLAVVLLLLLFEGGARLLAERSEDPGLRRVMRDFPIIERRLAKGFRFSPDENLPYRLRPGFTMEVDGQLTHHNAQGFRSPHDFAPKAPNTLRILCIGGSTTYGVGVLADDATYPACLERELRRSGFPKAEVLNLGVGGYTTVEVLASFERYGTPLKPDLVLIQCSINDVPPRFYPGFTCDYGHFRRALTLPRSSALSRLAYRSRLFLLATYESGYLLPLTLQDRTQPPWPDVDTMHENLQLNTPACFQENLEAILSAVKDCGARPVLLTQPYLEHPDFDPPDVDSARFEEAFRIGLRQHTEVVRGVAQSQATPLVDLATDFPMMRRHFTDPIHMTETGNAAKTRLMAATIAPLLRK